MKKNVLFVIMAIVMSAAVVGCAEKPASSESPSVPASSAPSAEPRPFTEVSGSYPFGVDIAALKQNPDIQLEGPQTGDPIVVIETSMGTIKLRMFPQYAPKAVESFMTHAAEGYYDGLIFHRVFPDFMIQGGDPLGTGLGGEDIWGGSFGLETTAHLHHLRGALAMAHSSLPDSNGSQFYIVQAPAIPEQYVGSFEGWLENPDSVVGESETGEPVVVTDLFPMSAVKSYLDDGGTPYLDFEYTVFGQAYEGLDVVDAISAVAANAEGKPNKTVKIVKMTVGIYE